MPAPQSLGPVPAFWQVSTPFGTTFHPCDLSRLSACAGLYGYGFDFSYESTRSFCGSTGTGP